MLRKILLMMIVASLILSVSIVSMASNVVIEENFNSMKIGAVPSGKWSLSGVDEGKSKITIVDRPEKKGDLCMEVVDNDNAKSAIVTLDFEAQKEDFTIAYEYLYKTGGNQPATLTVLEKGKWPPAITFMALSSITAVDSTTKAQTFKSGVALDRWHTIVLHISPTKGEYTVFLDNEKISEDVKFRGAENKSIDSIYMGIATIGQESTCYYDNVLIEKGFKAVDETKPINPGPAIPVATPYANPNSDKLTIVPAEIDLQNQMFKKIKNAMVLALNENNAFVGAEDRLIDENNLVVPFTIDGRTLVPVRFIAEGLGGKVLWKEETQEVGISLNGKEVLLKIGSKEIKIDGKVQALDVPANTYDGRTFIPLRAMVEAMGKKVFWDDMGLIVISDEDKIFDSSNDREVLDLLYRTIQNGRERDSMKSYASTFYSTRWFRVDSKTPDANVPNTPPYGSINMARQMMITNDLWSYATAAGTPEDYKALANSGVPIQAAVGGMPATGSLDAGSSRNFDGDYIYAPWVTSKVMVYGSAASQAFFDYTFATCKVYIDRGYYSIQHDDWLLDVSAIGWGGGFNDDFLNYFREYLKRTYSAEELKALGVDNIETFNYKTYLTEKLGVTNQAQYVAKRSQSKLNKAFEDCGLDAIIAYHTKLRKALNEYAGRTVEFSVNAGMVYGITHQQALANAVIDFQMGESPDGSYTAKNIAAWGGVLTGMGKSSIMSPIPKKAEGVKMGFAAAYAMGMFMSFPWDTYVEWDLPRYFGTTEDYGREYHFARQYENLFKNYENAGYVGVLAEKDNVVNSTYTALTAKLLENNISHRSLMTSKSTPKMDWDAQDLKGLSYIITYAPLEKFSKEQQDLINNSGIKLISMADVDSLMGERFANVTSSGTVYLTLREKNENNKVIHVLNQARRPLGDIAIEMKEKYIPANAKLTYYRPGFDPISLTAINGKVTLPETEIWGIIEITTEQTQMIADGVSFINIGSPIKLGNASFDGDTYTLASKGMGLNLGVEYDFGSFDQIAYAYRNFENSAISKNETSAYFESSADAKAKTGLMERKDTASNSPFIALEISNGSLSLVTRAKYNALTLTKKLKDVSLPVYLKLERVGSLYKAYTSKDGTNYELAGDVEFALDKRISGVFTSSTTNKEANITKIKSFTQKQELIASNISKLEIVAPPKISTEDNEKAEVFAVANDGKKTKLYKGDMELFSSDTHVLAIAEGGRLIGRAEGNATIIAKVDKLEKKATVTVTKPDPLIYKQDFNSITPGTIPKGMTFNNPKIRIEKSGESNTLVVSSDAEGKSSDVQIETPRKSGNVTFEFDYKAKFGKNENKGGSRVIYIGGTAMGVCLTADSTGFNYFFGESQTHIMPITENKWYKIRIVVDFNEKKADVYIDDEQVVTAGDFRQSIEDFSGIWFGGFRVNEDTEYMWDNVNVYQN